MKELSTYELWQLSKYGDIIPEMEDMSPVETDWFEKQCEIKELEN